jgi:hypothetical protein
LLEDIERHEDVRFTRGHRDPAIEIDQDVYRLMYVHCHVSDGKSLERLPERLVFCPMSTTSRSRFPDTSTALCAFSGEPPPATEGIRIECS